MIPLLLLAVGLVLALPAGARADAPAALAAAALAGLAALLAGAAFKYTLITRAAFNQGVALTRLPVRGVPR